MTSSTLIYNRHGHDDIEKAIAALTIANNACARDSQTYMLLSSDAVHLATRQRLEIRQVAGYKKVEDLLTSFVANGGRFWVDRACADARGVTAEDLIDGAELIDEASVLGFVDDNDQSTIPGTDIGE